MSTETGTSASNEYFIPDQVTRMNTTECTETSTKHSNASVVGQCFDGQSHCSVISTSQQTM